MPLIRPLWLEYPAEASLFSIQDEFMFGDSILIAPKLKRFIEISDDIDHEDLEMDEHQVNQVNVRLPRGDRWYSFYSK